MNTTTEKPILQLGDIKAFNPGVIVAGGHAYAADRTDVTIQDETRTYQAMNPNGVIVAILFFWTIVGLLGLLARETRITGNLYVTVRDRIDGRSYTEVVPIRRHRDLDAAIKVVRGFQYFTAWGTLQVSREVLGVNS